MMRFRVGPAALLVMVVVLAACSASSDPTYLTEEIPPCTPVDGGQVDPCDPGGRTVSFNVGSSHASSYIKDSPATIADYLGYDDVTAHIVVRATYLPDTVRCHATDYGRFAPWTNSPDSAGLAKCYRDVRVNSYIYGSGPPVLTVLLEEDYASGVPNWMEEAVKRRYIAGQEVVLFLGPALGYEVEVYQSFAEYPWNVVREDGTVKVAHPYRRYFLNLSESHRPAVEMTLDEFEARVVEAYEALLARYDGRVSDVEGAPAPQPDANKLHDYYVSVGAMDHPKGPPVLPPPVPDR